MNRLKKNQVCPLHRRRDCCGRAEFVRYPQAKKLPSINGVIKYPDGREKCSPAALRRRKDALMQKNPHCLVCGKEFTDYSQVDLAHRESKGLGGSRRDDRWENIYLMCRSGNRQQGSRDLEEYLADCKARGVSPCPENFA